MSKQTQIHQLLAIRSMIDAMLAEMTEDAEGECRHERKENLRVMGGGEKWRCLDCGFEYDEQEVNEDLKNRLSKEE